MHAVIPYVIAALLFALGVYGVLRRRNAILVLMAVELMLNAVNLILVAADSTMRSTPLTGVQPEAWAHPVPEPRAGSIFALFVIVLAAAEVGVGLAIVLQYYRLRQGVVLDDVALHAHDHETGRYETGPYESGPYETGPYETGPYETGPYETGQVAG
jgi:NADH-quinone oxidoreductase subunit K